MKNNTSRTRDMTIGSPIKLILAFAIPLFIGNIFQQVYSLVDTMIAGHFLGDSAIAAIGATSSIYSLLMNFAWGMNAGYAIIVTQSFGSQDSERFKKSAASMFTLNLILTIILTSAALIEIPAFMRFLNTPENIFDNAHTYIAIICGGMSTTMLYNMFSSFLRAMGNSKTPLYFLIISSLLNLGMDCLFVIVFRWGVAGTAIATVLAQLISAALCGAYILKNYREYLPGKEHFRLDKKLYVEMLSTGFAMAMMQCVVCLGSVIMQRAINPLGENVITANTAAGRIINAFMMPLSSVSTATSTFVGQNWGAGKIDRIKTCLKQSVGLLTAWSVFSAVVVWFLGGAMIIGITGTSNATIISDAVLKLRIAFALYVPLGILICVRMAMQAMGQKIVPLFASGLELLMKFVGALWIVPIYGYVGVCIIEPSTWLACGVLICMIYLFTHKKHFAKKAAEISEKANIEGEAAV